MNLPTAIAQYRAACDLRAAGRDFEAARAFLAAQRFAAHCRSGQRHRYIDYSHTGAVLAAKRVLEASQDHAQRSEAGRIIAESNFAYRYT